MTNYRLDFRTLNEAKQDIKNSHIHELDIVIRLGILYKQMTKRWPEIEPTGVDFTGGFIEDDKLITSQPDFLFDHQPLEVTRADKVCVRCFHQKANKARRYLKDNNANLVFANGYKTDSPMVLWLTPDKVTQYTDLAVKTYGTLQFRGFGYKDSYRYNLDWFKNMRWWPLPELTEDLPETYVSLLKAVVHV
ncbi:MAG: hypothetical protein WC942_01730 [Clostridia bacterium]|jgi:hypothetical protein